MKRNWPRPCTRSTGVHDVWERSLFPDDLNPTSLVSKPITTEILPDNLLNHRAVRAWATLKPPRVKPEAIETLRLKNKSSVYRLVGVGDDGSSVIAKRCRASTASVERMMYEEFLPRLPLPSLRYYGHVDEPGGEFCWLFLESADGPEYVPGSGAHRS